MSPINNIALTEQLHSLFEPALVAEMIEFGKEMKIEAGKMIMDYGKQVSMMPLIVGGTVKVMKMDDEGREILLYYLSDHDSCSMAFACCMESRRSEIRAVAEEDVTLIALPQQKLNEWICKYPSWKSYIFNNFDKRFSELLKSIEGIAFKKLDERLVAYLKERQRVGKSSLIKASHQNIAEELGTSRVVVSRLLKQLENDQKLLLYRNEIKLLKDF
ncbi:MAG: Crp/Fnr family transcriptional regulator [Sphingobacteriales bacterium]|nr:Crp/Fnr family transcriptional regulator [Sphingobacteriales bacterium]